MQFIDVSMLVSVLSLRVEILGKGREFPMCVNLLESRTHLHTGTKVAYNYVHTKCCVLVNTGWLTNIRVECIELMQVSILSLIEDCLKKVVPYLRLFSLS